MFERPDKHKKKARVMLGKFAVTAVVAAIATLSAASIGIIVTSSVPAAGKVMGMSASTAPVMRTETAFCAPKKAPSGDRLIFCGASAGKF